MIQPSFFYTELLKHNTDFFTGVPDSLLKSFCAYITDHTVEKNHSIAVHEGAAIALAAGYHLATGKIPLVYMQNSGIGNAINPLLSLADAEVYSIPLLLVIGWRGEPGVHDEPQHIKQGKVTCALLEAMGIPYTILADMETRVQEQIEECYAYIARTNAPYAFVVRKDTFAPYTLQRNQTVEAELSREEAIEAIIRASTEDELFFSTTGMASRELYEVREKYRQRHEQDFLTVGSMGHAGSIALAVALQKPDLPITCLDGDGALLMHLGALPAIGTRKPPQYRHILLNNGAHDSVGGQPTIALAIDIPALARAAGYVQVRSAKTRAELQIILRETREKRQGPWFIEIRIRTGARKDLGRPSVSPVENKHALMDYIMQRDTKTCCESRHGYTPKDIV
jgi:phosphonopyruvate decarboxylase